MNSPARARLGSIAAWLLLGTGVGVQAAQVEAAPAVENRAGPTAADPSSATAGAAKTPQHESLLIPSTNRTPAYADKMPPPRITERPGDAAPSARSQWIPGYWDWDTTQNEFVWVTGTWRVPPAGKFWVDGFWRHVGGKGWERVPGFWSERRDAPTLVSGLRVTRDWKRLGPPAERPPEPVGTAPAPDFFYIPGEFIPQGEALVWRPGFWYHSQPGWEWNPAHWIRQASGWAFRDGSWSRVPVMPASGPQGDPVLRGPTIVSTPAGSGGALNATSLNPLPSTSLEGRSGALPSGSAPTTEPAGAGTTSSTDVATGNRVLDLSPVTGEAAGTEGLAQPNGPSPAGLAAPMAAPMQMGAQPRYYYPPGYYPGSSMPWGSYPWGGRPGIINSLSQFLPF